MGLERAPPKQDAESPPRAIQHVMVGKLTSEVKRWSKLVAPIGSVGLRFSLAILYKSVTHPDINTATGFYADIRVIFRGVPPCVGTSLYPFP